MPSLFARYAIQRGIGAVPGLYRLQETVKSRIGRRDSSNLVASMRSSVAENMQAFRAFDIPPPRVVAEQGTGWHGIDLVMFYIAGAEQITTYDSRPWLREHLFRRAIDQAVWVRDAVASWPGIDRVEVARRYNHIRAVRDLPLRDALAALRIRWYVTTSFRRPDLADGSVDLFYSHSVLQRLMPGDLRTLIDESHRFLHPSGQVFHQIDCKDFHSITDRRIPELYYLLYPRWLWRLMTTKYLNYQNRLRLPTFLALHESAGYETRVGNATVKPENVAFARRHLSARPDFAELQLDEIATSRFDLLATPRHKEATSVARPFSMPPNPAFERMRRKRPC